MIAMQKKIKRRILLFFSPILSTFFFLSHMVGKKFSFIDITACLCMSVGLILFSLADSVVSPNFNPYGMSRIMLFVRIRNIFVIPGE